MIQLTSYQKYLLIAYTVGIFVQILLLYIVANHVCNDLEFSATFAIIYIIFSFIQFVSFLKLINQKEQNLFF